MLRAVALDQLDQVVGGKREMKRALHPEIWDKDTVLAVERWKKLPLKGATRQGEAPAAPPEKKPDAPAQAACRVSILGWCLWR